MGDSLSGPARWSPDGLFYQARVYEIRDGMSQPEALREAFQGPLGERLRAIDPERSGSPQWVAYNARFYERRVAVPYVASLRSTGSPATARSSTSRSPATSSPCWRSSGCCCSCASASSWPPA